MCNSTNCTLREAIAAANASNGSDLIQFSVVTFFQPVINVGSSGLGPLPQLGAGITLDGTTSRGSVILDGSSVPAQSPSNPDPSGLVVTAGSDVITKVVVRNFPWDGIQLLDATNGAVVSDALVGIGGGNAHFGIYVSGTDDTVGTSPDGGGDVVGNNSGSAGGLGVVLAGSGNTVSGDSIGVNGGSAVPNQWGLVIWGASNMVSNNVISGNTAAGVLLGANNSTGNTITGNAVGTNAAGTSAIGNGSIGIWVDGNNNTNVAGTTVSDNLVSGNAGTGIYVEASSTANTAVTGNTVGTDTTGSAAIPNAQGGIVFWAGASSSATGNLVSGNTGDGIGVYSGSTGITLENNTVGLTASGGAALGNTGSGIRVDSSSNTTIGAPGGGNVVSANGDPSTFSSAGIALTSAGAATIQGNFVGTNAGGTAPLGNAWPGVFVQSSSQVTIGGTAAGDRNVISGNRTGVYLYQPGTTGDLVEGNYIGTNSAGSIAVGNHASGVYLLDAPANTIGGSAPGAGNVISGNDTFGVTGNGGITLAGAATGNLIEGNLVGVDAGGTTGIGNEWAGIYDSSSGQNTIGGTADGAGNIVSGNNDGVYLVAPKALVEGNLIGTNAAGTAAIGNAFSGVVVGGANDTIGGTTAPTRNVISGNGSNGIYVAGASETGAQVDGNYIGTDLTGAAALGNHGSGIAFATGVTGNTVGGLAAGAGNVISANGDPNSFSSSGVWFQDNSAGNTVQGNLIGTDASGQKALGNVWSGVLTFGSGKESIGGSTAAARNVISGNQYTGVFLYQAASTANLVQGNLIGVAADGTTALGNASDGVLLASAPGNIIGGPGPAANMIMDNGGSGVGITDATATGNRIGPDSIDRNAGLGIDLGDDGPTANDSGDADAGPNHLQNFPAVLSATQAGKKTTVRVRLASTPAASFTLDIYSSPAADTSGYGEGATWRASATATTDGAGVATATVTVPVKLALGTPISATATAATGDTSELSPVTRTAAAKTAAVSVQDSQFIPASVTVKIGGTLQWNFFGPSKHTATDATGLSLYDSGSEGPGATFAYSFENSGKYAVASIGDSFTGTVSVPLGASPTKGSSTTTFTLTWGAAPLVSPYAEDVQIAYCATKCKVTFQTWRTTPATSDTFSAGDPAWHGAGTYYFRARLRNVNTSKATDWSPTIKIAVS